jgi:hypothetical protein
VGTNFLAIEFTASGYKYSINGSDPVEVVTPVSVGLFSDLLVGTCSGNTSLGGHVSLLAYTPRTGLNLKSLTQAGNVELDFAANEYLIGSADLSGPTQISVPFSSVLNFVRTSKGWGFDSSIDLVEYASNTPRFVYDPVTGEARGFLSEVQRAQLLTNTEVRSGAGWDSASGGVLTNLSEDYLGRFRGCRVASGGDLSAAASSGTYSVTSGTTYCMQSLVQVGTSGRIRLIQTTGSGTSISVFGLPGLLAVGATSGGTAEVIQDSDLGGGFRWITVRFVPNFTGTTRCRIGPDSTTVGEDIIAIAAQVEEGPVPTSLIISEGLATTRTRDECVVTFADLGINPANGYTIVADVHKEFAEGSNSNFIFQVSDGTLDNRVHVRSSAGNALVVQRVASGTGTTSALTGTAVAGRNKIAVTHTGTTMIVSVNGLTAQTFTTNAPASSLMTQIGLLLNDANLVGQWNGTAKDFRILPAPLTASQLQVMSAL